VIKRNSYKGNKRKSVHKSAGKSPFASKKISPKIESETVSLIRLNKFISNAGICSRREADKLIVSGTIKVNGKVVTDLGIKVSPKDKVQYEGETIKPEKKYYVLLNKPKGYITTTDDPFDRKTVMFLVKNACRERIYPVGRLDRDTTGVLLLTNDGELAKKLTHPRHRVNKIYHVVLDKNLKKTDLQKIVDGVELEDGITRADSIAYVEGVKGEREIGIEIHSGKNRVIRRIFESLGYQVVKLDRVLFAGLTKKDVPRGKWRHLSEREVGFLRML
jgi:23S rRNA pseudouridine2605 synthase